MNTSGVEVGGCAGVAPATEQRTGPDAKFCVPNVPNITAANMIVWTLQVQR